jgi:MFS transporter, DHA1 family, tetracycline resistance protein
LGYPTGVDRRQEQRATTLPSSVERLPAEIRVLVGAAFVVAVGYGIAAPALPAFARSFDVGVAAASAVISAFAVVRIAFAPLSGRLVGRLGELPVFCAGLVVVGLSSAGCAVAVDYPQLLVLRAIGGVGSTMFTVSAASIVLRVAPPQMRGRASGAWATGFLLGTVAGPAVGGAVVTASLRAPFLVYAALLAVATVVSFGFLRRRVGPRPRAAGALAPVRFGALLRHPTFRAALAANFLTGWTVYGVRVALVPLFVADVLQAPNVWAGAALTASALGTAAGLQVGGRWSDRRGRRAPVLAGSAVIAVTALWLGLSTTMVPFLLAALLGGVGTGLMTPAVNAAVGDLIMVPDRDTEGGAALAGYQMVGYIGAVVGPVVAGVVVERAGYGAAFATTAIIAVVSLVAWLRVPATIVQ